MLTKKGKVKLGNNFILHASYNSNTFKSISAFVVKYHSIHPQETPSLVLPIGTVLIGLPCNPARMAPEVISNKASPIPYDFKADIWSLGITLLELAHGEPPLSELHPMKALFQIPFRDPPTLLKPQAWSTHFNEFLSRCLARDPKDRSSATQLLQVFSLFPLLLKQQASFYYKQFCYTRRSSQPCNEVVYQVLCTYLNRYVNIKNAAEAAEAASATEDVNDEEQHAILLLKQVETQKKAVLVCLWIHMRNMK